jgi:hypothetical protein
VAVSCTLGVHAFAAHEILERVGELVVDKGFGTQYLELGFQDLIPGTWVSGLNIWNSIFSIWDSGLNIRHLGFGTQNQELLDILNSGFRT